MIYLQFINSGLMKENFFIRECFLWAVFALSANFAPFAFGTNALFIEKQIISPLPVFKMMQAKYRLYCIIAVVFFIVFLPCMLLGVKFMELTAAFLFATGFAFFGLFYSSLLSYKGFDIKASYFMNYQGTDSGNYFFPMVVMMAGVGFVALFYWLFNETVTLIAMSLVGLVFIVTNKIWLEKIGKSFEKTKYRRLECFREK
jgi:hypothetical protein